MIDIYLKGQQQKLAFSMSEMSEDYDFERCNGLDGKMPLGNDTH
jgi:hypothetical protein